MTKSFFLSKLSELWKYAQGEGARNDHNLGFLSLFSKFIHHVHLLWFYLFSTECKQCLWTALYLIFHQRYPPLAFVKDFNQPSINSDMYKKVKGKAVPLQAWSGPEGSRKLRFPHFMTTAQDGGKIVSLTHRPHLPQEMFLILISVRSWVDPSAIVRSEGYYFNEKFQWLQLGSIQRPSDL